MAASERPIRARSNPAEQDQDQEDDDHEAQSTAAVVAGAVEWPAAKTAEASKQDDDQDDEQNGSDRHEIVSKCTLACCKEKLRLAAQLTMSSVREKRQQNDDRDRNAKQPEKNASTHDLLLYIGLGMRTRS